jgi:glucosamine--fructose-6-phosphate aminotransferase (isomerizing)
VTAPRTAHPFQMFDAMHAQPAALRAVGHENAAALDAAASAIGAAERVVVAGIGSSWHAALCGERLLAHAGLGPRVRAVSTFELAAYGPAPDARTATIVVSHGGGNRYVRESVDTAVRAGSAVIAITGKGHDSLAAAPHVLRTVEPEVSSTHTVSYTTAVALFAALAVRLGARDLAHDLDALPDRVATVLAREAGRAVGGRHAGRRRYWVLGAGANVATAHEAALKMSEAAHASAVGFEIEQVLHGPWAAVEADDLVVTIAPGEPAYERAVMAARVAREIGAAVVSIAGVDDEAGGAETIALPPTAEVLTPLLAIVPLQLIAYHLALARGTNPDTMRTHEPAYGRARRAMTL